MSFGSNRRTDLFPQITTPSISECALIQSAIDPILLRLEGPQTPSHRIKTCSPSKSEIKVLPRLPLIITEDAWNVDTS